MDTNKTPLLQIRKLQTDFRVDGQWRPVLHGIDFEINRNETVAVVGESGSGKSVTALSILKLLPPNGARLTSGEVMFDGRDMIPLSERDMSKIRGNSIGMIFQEPMTSLNPTMSVGDQIAEVIGIHKGATSREARKEALSRLEEVRIPAAKERFNCYPHEFSGGMRQRVMIAMALACRPKILIADEPTTALDVTVQAQILDLLQELKNEFDMSVLFITHDMGVVAETADRVLVMYKGDLVEQADTTTLFRAPQHPYTQRLLKAVPKLGAMINEPAPRKMVGVESEVSANTTHNSRPIFPSEGAPLLEVNGLTTRFDIGGGLFGALAGRLHAVEDVSFTLQPSETLSLVGESGCGKSTTGRSVLQLLKPNAGSVKFQGSEITGLSRGEIQKLRCKMQMIFQDPYASLNPRMPVAKAIAEPMIVHKLADARQAMERAVELIRKVGLSPDMAGRLPHEFSGGQRQRLCIARALALNPKLIVADESVSALDVSVKAQVLNLLLDLQADLGLSYLFISHDIATVEQVSHRIAVMYLGEIVEIGPRAAIIGNPQHPYTQKLLAAVPIPDPTHRGKRAPIPAADLPNPFRPAGYVPVRRTWRTVADNHLVQEAHAV